MNTSSFLQIHISISSTKLTCLSVILYVLVAIQPTQTFAQTINNNAIETLCKASEMKGASIGIAVYSMQDGKKLYGKNESLNLRPASIQKLFTTGLILKELGADFTYKTEYGFTGTLDSSTVHNGLYFIGSGDPTVGSRFFDDTKPEVLFEDILKNIKKGGIRQIYGGIRVVNCPWTERPVPDSWLWQDVGNYYGVASSGFTFMDNTFYLITEPATSAGDTVIVKETYPPLPGIHIKSYVTAANISGDESYIYGGNFHHAREFRGNLPVNKSMKIKGALPNPGKVFADELSKYLTHHGILVQDHSKTVHNMPTNFHKVGTIESPLLSQIAKITNKKSHNLFAEQLMLTLTNQYTEYPQQLKGLQKYLTSMIPSAESCAFYDACGLSVFDMGTADVYAQFLQKMQNNAVYADFQTTLPVAGYDGTLKYWCKSNGMQGKVFAKTGSMTGVRSLAGYLLCGDGSLRSFCVIVNNYSCSDAEAKSFLESLLPLIGK